MNSLYYVVCYSHRHNQNSRWHVTTDKSELDARRQVEDRLEGGDWKVVRMDFVCTTEDTVCRAL